MKNVHTKRLIEATVVIAVALAMLMPCTMANANEETAIMTMDPVWEENFDSYENGSSMHGQGGWKGWDNDPIWTAYVTDVESQSAPQSVDIKENADLVHEYDGLTAGQFVFTAWQYIPTEFEGNSYFILLSHYEDFGGQDLNKWALQLRFDSANEIVESEHGGPSLDLITGRWVEIRTEIDLDIDEYSCYYDNELLETKAWTAGPNNDFTGYLEIDAVDLFANGATTVYYDDLSIEGEVTEQPDIMIENIAGGLLSVTADVKNNGTGDATDVDWSIKLDGGLIILGKETTGTIASLPAGQSEQIKSGLVFGLGKTTVKVYAECAEGPSGSGQADATVLFILILI